MKVTIKARNADEAVSDLYKVVNAYYKQPDSLAAVIVAIADVEMDNPLVDPPVVVVEAPAVVEAPVVFVETPDAPVEAPVA
jgi:hypothetical protein